MQIMNLRAATSDTVIGLPVVATAQPKARTSFDEVLAQVRDANGLALSVRPTAADGAQGDDGTAESASAGQEEDAAERAPSDGLAPNPASDKADQLPATLADQDLGPDSPSDQDRETFADRTTSEATARDTVAESSPSRSPDPDGTQSALSGAGHSKTTPLAVATDQGSEPGLHAEPGPVAGIAPLQPIRPDAAGAASAIPAAPAARVALAQAGGPTAPSRIVRPDLGVTQQADPQYPVPGPRDEAEVSVAITPPQTRQTGTPMSTQSGTPPGWVPPRPGQGGLPGMLAAPGGVQSGEAFWPVSGETGLPASDAPRQSAVPAPAAPAVLSFRPVAMQIAMALPTAADGSVEITLSPRELGQVRLSLSPGETGLVLTMLAERPETLDMLRRHAAELGQDLRSLGYHDVDFRFGGNSARDPSPDMGGRRDRDLPELSDGSGAMASEDLKPRTMIVSGSLDIRL